MNWSHEPFRTWRDVRVESVMRFKADIDDIQGSEIEPWPSDVERE
jgi:hypothetical protein